jgi:hypothetical protein
MPATPFFLKDKPQTGIVSEHRSESETSDNFGLMAAAEELINAIKSGSAQGVAAALKSAFELMDSQPHEEGPHEGSE